MGRGKLSGIVAAGAFLFLALPAFALESDNFTYTISSTAETRMISS
jgi:hypothetical protein